MIYDFKKMNFSKIKNFLLHGIWFEHIKHFSFTKRIIYKVLRIIILSIRQYNYKKCGLQASSLTLITLFSIVPLVALFFGIAKNFGLEKTLKKQVYKSFKDYQEIVDNIIHFSETLLSSAKGGVVAGIGFIVLIFTTMRLLYYIEMAFNKVWEVKKSRSIIRIITDYLSIMTIAPILIAFSSDIFIIVIKYLINFASITAVTDVLPFSFSILDGVRYLLFSLMLALVYTIMPNISVKPKYALIGGFITGFVYIIIEDIYIKIQTSVSNYNTIYGSFAVFPLFLLWLQISWYIILYGATLVYSSQNTEEYRSEYLKVNFNKYQRTLIALSLTNFIIKRFDNEDTTTSYQDLATYLDLPRKSIEDVIKILLKNKILIKTKEEGEFLFLPALNGNKITVEQILNALDFAKEPSNPVLEDFKTELDQRIKDLLYELETAKKSILNNKLVKNL